MKARSIKYFFSGTLFATAMMMSAYSCAGVTSYETRNKHHLFAVQVEKDYLLNENSQDFNSAFQGCNKSKQPKQVKPRKEVSWTGWITNSNNSSFHFLDLLELIGS